MMKRRPRTRKAAKNTAVYPFRVGIGNDIHYPVPDHKQGPVARSGAAPSLPITEACCTEVLTLPCFPELSDNEVDRVIDVVCDLYG